MAIGDKTDFVIYEDEAFAGFSDMIKQRSDLFNEASRGAITLVTRAERGDFTKRSFIDRLSGLVTRRDITATTAATGIAVTQDEQVSVKLNRKGGPIEQTLDSWAKIMPDEDTTRQTSFRLGEQLAKAFQVNMIDAAIRGCEAALDGVVALEHNRSAGTLRSQDLADGLGKLGDASNEMVVWVMHSKVATDLLKEQMGLAITNVSDVNIIEGTIATLGRPTLIVDSPALIEAGSPDTYITLGLKVGAVSCVESELPRFQDEIVTGLENLVGRVQVETAFNLGVLGFKFGATINPTDAQVATTGNWTQVFASHKSLAGCRIYSQ